MKTNWQIKKLGEVCEISTGKSNTNEAVENGEYAFFDRSKTIKRSMRFLFDCEALIIPGEGAEFFPRYYSGKFDLHQRAYALFSFDESVNIKFVEYYLIFDHKYFERVAVGATAKSLRLRHFQDILMPLPPLPAQHRIVKILDEVFEKTTKAKENAEKNLQNARELFDSFLQNVFENKGDNFTEEKMVNVCSVITCGVASTPRYVNESVGVPFLSAQNVRNGEIVLDKYNFISKEFHEQLTKKNKPSKGDILYSRVGAKYGEAGVVEHNFDFSVYVSLTLIRTIPEKLNSYYLKYYLNSPAIKSLAKKSITSSGVPNLNVADVREFPIKYPSLIRQEQIINQIKIVSAEIKRLEAIYQQKLADLQELKKSILQKAFNGELAGACS